MVFSKMLKACLVLVLLLFSIKNTHCQQKVGLLVEHAKTANMGETVGFKIYGGDELAFFQIYANEGSLGKIQRAETPTLFSFKFNYAGIKKLKFQGLDKMGIVLRELESTITITDQGFVPSVKKTKVLNFPPTPNEDEINGKNNNAYLAAKTGLSYQEKIDFINSIIKYAQEIGNQYNVPASAILGISALESGYGFTRTAYFANNLMGIKKWGVSPENAYQLKGQPDEDEGKVKVIRKTATGELIFDESKRQDNWYEKFSSREECLRFFVEIILLNIDDSRWREHRKPVINHEKNMVGGMDKKTASRQFVFELGENGYNHLGGKTYLKRVEKVMDELNLYQYDH